MKLHFNFSFFIFAVLLILCFVENSECEKINGETPVRSVRAISLSGYNGTVGNQLYTQRVTLGENEGLQLMIKNVSRQIAFMVVQVHTFIYNVTLAYDEASVNNINKSFVGTNIGLVIRTDGQKDNYEVFIKTNHNNPVESLIAIVTYSVKDPLPGGCNMEYNVEMAPVQNVTVKKELILVDFQPATILDNNPSNNCPKDNIAYDNYQMFIDVMSNTIANDSYFSAIEKMLTVDEIKKNAEKAPKYSTASKYRSTYSAYYGKGRVFATVAVYGDSFSAYVPAVTYACDISNMDSCAGQTNWFNNIFYGLLFIYGLCLAIFSAGDTHLTLQSLMFFSGFLINSLIISCFDIDYSGELTIALAPIFTVIFLAFTCCSEFLGVVMPPLTLGFIISSITYFFLPANVTFLADNGTFVLFFVSVTAAVFVALLIMNYFGKKVMCAFVGSSCMILTIDYFMNTTFKYVLMNVMRRLVTPGFDVAVTHVQLSLKEYFLVCIWMLLLIASVYLQKTIYRDYREVQRDFIEREISLLRSFQGSGYGTMRRIAGLESKLRHV